VTDNPLVAAPVDEPKSPWAGVRIAEDIELIGSVRIRRVNRIGSGGRVADGWGM
jgi:hypothetical protein